MGVVSALPTVERLCLGAPFGGVEVWVRATPPCRTPGDLEVVAAAARTGASGAERAAAVVVTVGWLSDDIIRWSLQCPVTVGAVLALPARLGMAIYGAWVGSPPGEVPLLEDGVTLGQALRVAS